MTVGVLLFQQERDDKEGKSHHAEEEEPEVWQVLEKFKESDEQQVECSQQDYGNNNPGWRDVPEQPYLCHRSCSGQVNS